MSLYSSPSSFLLKAFGTFVLISISCLDSSHGQPENALLKGVASKTPITPSILTEKTNSQRTIFVDAEGKGDFKSVQAAVDSVPVGNTQWITIDIKGGLYSEKVQIPKDKPFIFMRGSGVGETTITWTQHSSSNIESATLRVEASDFICYGVRIKNEAPTGVAFTSQNQSVAAFVAADRVAFYQCAFHSNHNTLFDYKGRHYYDECYIQGSIDFIFGRAKSVFYDCELFIIEDLRVSIHGSITANSRENPNENSGFVFIKGKVYGMQDAYLGRAKSSHSRVVFVNTYFSSSIVGEGWTSWSYQGNKDHVFLAEHKCTGPGANIKTRAPWTRQLTDAEAAPFQTIEFINGSDWLPAWRT